MGRNEYFFILQCLRSPGLAPYPAEASTVPEGSPEWSNCTILWSLCPSGLCFLIVWSMTQEKSVTES